MRVPQIRYFLAVADAGSVRAGARRAGITQPAMTKSLRQLEEALGARLFLRTARGITLTAAGRAFRARASVVDAELRRAEEDLAQLRGDDATASVAMGIAPAITLAVPDAMAIFRRKFADARVRVVEGVRTALLGPLRDEHLDFVVAQNPGGPAEAGLRFRPLLRPRLVVAGRKGHPLGQARTLRELADASWLVFNPPGAGGMLERAFRASGLPAPRCLVECESYASALALLVRSDLLGLVFARLFDEPMAARFLHRFELEEQIDRPSLGMFVRGDSPLAPAAAAMAQAMTVSLRARARGERAA